MPLPIFHYYLVTKDQNLKVVVFETGEVTLLGLRFPSCSISALFASSQISLAELNAVSMFVRTDRDFTNGVVSVLQFFENFKNPQNNIIY